MNRPPSSFWPAAAALAAGVSWLALGADSLLRPHPERYRDAWLLVPWVLTMLVLAGIHRVQRDRAGTFGAASFAFLAATMPLVGTGQAAVVADATSLAWLAFPVGLLAWTVAMVLFGIAIVRAQVLPPWCGVAVALAEPLVVATGVALSSLVPLSDYGSYSGALAHGAIFLAVGWMLLRVPARAEARRPMPATRWGLRQGGKT